MLIQIFINYILYLYKVPKLLCSFTIYIWCIYQILTTNNNTTQNTDPSAYEMTVKVRVLQKRLLEQCTRVFDKDLQVQEMQTRYEKLKDEFIKLPGRDVYKDMNNMKIVLMKKEDKLKVMLVRVLRFDNMHKHFALYNILYTNNLFKRNVFRLYPES